MRLAQDLFLRALIWGFSGAVFGGLLVVLQVGLGELLADRLLLVCASTVIAGGITASFFGAMRVALFGSAAGVLVAIGFLIGRDSLEPLYLLLAAAAVAGMVAGSTAKLEELLRNHPLGQCLSGMLAGLIAGPLLFLTARLANIETVGAIAAAVSVGLVGLAFVALSGWVINHSENRLTLRLSGMLVSAFVAAAMAASMWMFTKTGLGVPGQAPDPSMLLVQQHLSWSVLGGAIAGVIGGIGLELLGVERREYHL